MKDLPHVVWMVPAVMLLIAAAPLPYGYYMFLRLVICVAAGLLAYLSYQEARSIAWTTSLALLALLFNPIVPIHMARAVWAPINLSSVALIAAHYWFVRCKL